MAIKNILLLGNPALYKVCSRVERDELTEVKLKVKDLHDTLNEFKEKYNAGRAIAAPQIGYFKRIVYMNIDKPIVFINPILDVLSADMFELWDDCMSFPEILVKVKRHKKCHIAFKNLEWEDKTLALEGGLAELLQHEVDHLNGILAISRAVDSQSIALKSQKEHLNIQLL
jgi:peptide deformylase